MNFNDFNIRLRLTIFNILKLDIYTYHNKNHIIFKVHLNYEISYRSGNYCWKLEVSNTSGPSSKKSKKLTYNEFLNNNYMHRKIKMSS